jgi:hypothetical protein
VSRLYASQLLTVGKESYTLREWSRITGVKTTTMYWRLKHDYSPEDVIAKPYERTPSTNHQGTCLLTVGDETRTLRDWSISTGVKMNTMYWRMARGYKPEDVVAKAKSRVSLRHRQHCNRGHRMTVENHKQRSDGTVICRQCYRDSLRAHKTKQPITYALVQARAPNFWKLIKRAPGNKCWLWQGARDRNGYGTFNVGYHVVRAHRVALILKLGRLINGMACHKCGNPRCCRKAHIYEGNNKTNALDTVRHGRTTRGEHNAQAKLTEAAVLKIRASYQRGITTQRKLAARFAVSQTTIALIIKRLIWSHI